MIYKYASSFRPLSLFSFHQLNNKRFYTTTFNKMTKERVCVIGSGNW